MWIGSGPSSGRAWCPLGQMREAVSQESQARWHLQKMWRERLLEMALSEWEEATLEELKFANAAGSPSASPAWAALPELWCCFVSGDIRREQITVDRASKLENDQHTSCHRSEIGAPMQQEQSSCLSDQGCCTATHCGKLDQKANRITVQSGGKQSV